MNTLTLSGWTQPADDVARALAIGAATFDYSEYTSAHAAFEALHAYGDTPHIVAWSLGAQLAMRAIAAGVLNPRHLTIIAAPYQFVQTPDFGTAMGETTFAMFRENYATNPARTKERFHGLVAKGDRDTRRILSLLGHHPQVENTVRWLPWLDELGSVSLQALDLSRVPPTLIVHGTQDAIVPVAQAQMLADQLPSASVSLWEGVAHAPHWHDGARLLREIETHRAQHA